MLLTFQIAFKCSLLSCWMQNSLLSHFFLYRTTAQFVCLNMLAFSY